MIGSWAVDQAIENMIVTAVFGLLGYAMIRFDYPRLPMVIALVLGANIERSYHQSLAMSDQPLCRCSSRGRCRWCCSC